MQLSRAGHGCDCARGRRKLQKFATIWRIYDPPPKQGINFISAHIACAAVLPALGGVCRQRTRGGDSAPPTIPRTGTPTDSTMHTPISILNSPSAYSTHLTTSYIPLRPPAPQLVRLPAAGPYPAGTGRASVRRAMLAKRRLVTCLSASSSQ